MHKFRIVEEGKIDGVKYMLVNGWKEFEQSIFDSMMDLGMPGIYDYYTGYAKIPVTPVDVELKSPMSIDGLEITYGPDSNQWIGFDTMHVHMQNTTEDEAREMVEHFAKGVKQHYG